MKKHFISLAFAVMVVSSMLLYYLLLNKHLHTITLSVLPVATIIVLCLILSGCLAVHVTPEMQSPLTVTISGAGGTFVFNRRSCP